MDFSDLLFYLHVFCPANYAEILRACYERVRQPFCHAESKSAAEPESPASGFTEEKQTLARLQSDDTPNTSSGGLNGLDRWAHGIHCSCF